MPEPSSVIATPRALTVLEKEAILRTPFDVALIEAIRAIPGRVFDPRTKHWHVGLANERPTSLLMLLDHFDDVEVTEEGELHLRELALRKPKAFGLELVQPVKGAAACVSLMDRWRDPELHELLERFDHFLHPEVGRISLVLTPPSALAVKELHDRRADVLWTRKLAEHVNTLAQRARPKLERDGEAGGPVSTVDGDGNGHDGGGQSLEGRWITVRFTEGRSRVFITTSQVAEVLKALPDSEPDGHQVVVAPASRLVAAALAALQVDGHQLQMSPTVRQWMEASLRWDGHVTAVSVNGEPRFQITGDDEAHPTLLDAELVEHPADDVWHLPLTPEGAEVITDLLDAEPLIKVDAKARRCLEALDQNPGEAVRPALLVAEDAGDGQTAFRLTVMWDDDAAKEFAKLPGSSGGTSLTKTDEAVTIGDAWNAGALRQYRDRYDLDVDEDTDAVLEELAVDNERAEELVAMSQATEGAELSFAHLPGGDPMPFQIAGVEYALDRRRTFIADEQGLGKTLQALLTVEQAEAFPAVVLCPASLKLNWKREVGRWLPHRSIQVMAGRGQVALEADVIVLNYEIVEAHGDALAQIRPGALVLDEAHYCKSPNAKRTRAVQALADKLPDDSLRLALTGTPLVNRPKELVPQLRILGRLAEFGSGAGFERRFGSAEERERLHWHLRRTCYVRRLKKDVLPQLPEKQRAVVPLALSNHAQYERAERGFMEWLVEQFQGTEELGQRLNAALRSQALVKIGALRKLAGHGKVHTAVHWIQDFLESGEKLVVFASHRDVQHAIAEHFPDAVHILGSDAPEARDAAVQRFQNDPNVQLCVCSLKVAAHGLTLTAAANVAFVELGWTPAEHDQAEDRCHRIGQEDSVTAWYLIATGTIDERIAQLIEHKRAIVGAVTDGKAVADIPAIDAILADYLQPAAAA